MQSMSISLGNLLGFVSLTLLTLQFVLSSRSKFLDRIFGLDKLMRWHNLNGKLMLLVVLLHPAFIFTNWLEFMSFPEILQSLTLPQTLGTITFLLMIAVAVTSVYSARLTRNYEQWQKIHKLTYVVLSLGFFHAYFSGSLSYGVTPFWYWYVFLSVIVTWAVITRLYGRYVRSTEYEITKIKQELDGVSTVFLKPKSGEVFKYEIAQFAFITFYSEGLPIEEHHFTLTSLPGQKEISFTIKASGDYTSQLHHLKVGDTAKVDGGFGALHKVNWAGKELLLVAGGIGITPIFAILKQLDREFEKRGVAGNSLPSKVKLVYSAKTSDELIFHDEISKIAKHNWLDVYYCLSREKDQKVSFANVKCVFGRFQDNVLRSLRMNTNQVVAVLVGPLPMMNEVSKMLVRHGVTRKDILTEEFSLKHSGENRAVKNENLAKAV